MSLVTKIRDVIGDSDEREFTYQCGSCENLFTSTTADMGELKCPGCGKNRVHQVRPE